MSDELNTTKQVMDAYLQPAIKQAERIRAKYHDVLTKAIMGEHTCEEVEPGMWKHTFAPHSYASTQATDTMTADELLRIAEGIKDQRTQEWLEEYERYSRASMLREIEEMSKPLYDTPYMRYLAWQPQIVIPSVRLLPFRAEGTPRFSPLEMHQATIRLRRSARRIMAAHRDRKRTRRKQRAAFRRIKRGLA